MRLFAYIALLLFVTCAARAQPVISYITPDAGAPGMCVAVEFIGAIGTPNNFDVNDGFITAGDRVRLVVAADSQYVKLGPAIVSWQGRVIQQMLFIEDNAPDAKDIQLQVVNANGQSNIVHFTIRFPAHVGMLSGSQVIGGARSARNTMIVDSMILTNGTFTCPTSDPDPGTAGNQAYLPFRILSKGPIRLVNATLSANGQNATTGTSGGNGGPGGGGGGAGYPAQGGSGFTGGGGDASNSNCGGVGSGGVASNPSGGQSLSGATGGDGEQYVSSGDDGGGGGTGHPFGSSGGVSYASPSAPGGFGGGSAGGSSPNPYSNDYGGGGGGFATDGTNGQGAGNDHGQAQGNKMVVPLSGGSGGGAGNVTYVSFIGGSKGGSGGGGGGVIELTSFATVTMGSGSNGAVTSNGGAGSNGVPQTGFINQPAAAGGGGSGGAVVIGARDSINIGSSGSISITGGTGGTSTSSNANGGNGGLGRVRLDGFVVGGGASNNYFTPTKDFPGPSIQKVIFSKDSFEVIGHGVSWDSRADSLPVALWWTWSSNTSVWYPGDATPILDPTSHTWKWTSGQQAIPDPTFDTELYVVAVQADTINGLRQMMTHTSGIIAKVVGPAKVSTNTTVINFDSVLVGKCSHDTTFKIYSVGQSDLIISQIDITGADASQFVVSTNPTTLKKGDSLTITVKFCPTSIKCPVQATLRIYTNDQELHVALIGCAIQPQIAVRPDPIDFGDVAVGSCVDTLITITNQGTAPLTITNELFAKTQFTAPGASVFPDTILPGASIKLRIRFCPDSTLLFVSTDTVVSDAPIPGAITLMGRGVREFLSIPRILDFGNVHKNDCKKDSFYAVNSGNVALHVLLPVVLGTGFTLVSPVGPFDVAAHDSVLVTLQYCSSTVGTQNGSTALNTTAPSIDSLQLTAFTGEGVLQIPAVIDFGSVRVGACKDTVVTITNSGTDTLILLGANSFLPPFSYQSVDPIILAPGASGSIKIRFCPTDVPALSQVVQLDTVIYGNSPQFVVRGSGEHGALAVAGIPVDFGCLMTSVTSTDVIRYQNTGNGQLTLISAVFITSKNVSITKQPGSTVAAGASDSITITVSSPTTDTVYAILELQYQGIPPFDIPITGRFSTAPKIVSLDSNIQFAPVNIGDSSTDTCIRITNYSCVGIDRGNMTLTGTGSGSFRIVSVSPYSVLADSQIATICVRFVPNGSGPQSAQILATNGTGSTTIGTLSGTGSGRPVAVQLALDTVYGKPGQIVQTAVRTLNDVTAAAITSLTFRVTFDPMQLDMKQPQPTITNSIAKAQGSAAPVFSIKQYAFGDKEVTATYSSPLTGNALIAALPFEILLPTANTASIHLQSASFGTSPATLSSTADGQIRIEQCDTSENFSIRPSWIKVAQNSPNPFNPRTAIELEIGAAGHLKISLWNALGELVLTPFDEDVTAGLRKVEIDANTLPSGMYHYITTWAGTGATLRDEKTMILVK